MARKRVKIVCLNCKAEVVGNLGQKYCGKKCRDEYLGMHGAWKHLNTATVGAIQELRVSVDLFMRGYEVFRSLSPASWCDLLVSKDGKFVGVEVRTAYKHRISGVLYYPKKRIGEKQLALCTKDEIVYLPELP